MYVLNYTREGKSSVQCVIISVIILRVHNIGQVQCCAARIYNTLYTAAVYSAMVLLHY
jgi:hypothetical protein